MGIGSLIFLLLLIVTSVVFYNRIKFISRNIKLGRDITINDRTKERWITMAKVALGQSKMVVRPVAGFMHILIYLGFIIINIEILEIIIDGLFGTHRVSSEFLGGGYKLFINIFEILAIGVLLACVVFLVRRNVIKLKRFWSQEMTSWPRSDANIILIVEILLMGAFLIMNAADSILLNTPIDPNLATLGLEHYSGVEMNGSGFLVSQFIASFLPQDLAILAMIERVCWWFHIVGVFAFLIYVTYSKHFHIFLAFPNIYYSNLNNKGKFKNLEAVKKEVELMMDPSADPYANPPEGEQTEVPKFGAKDIQDLTWKQLMDAYSCTECGRCTSVCPANQTGKLLSPRKIMMDTRDRMEEYGKGLDKFGKAFKDEKSLLGDYITHEEVWACTTCNACTEACPVNIDPLSIIIDLRQHLVMEESAAPSELNNMFSNVENNGAPWQFAQADRMNWATEN